MSPANKLFGRTIRNNLPYQRQDVIPPKLNLGKMNMEPSQQHALPDLEEGDTVRIRDRQDWRNKGIVVKKSKYPRSYIVKNEKGNELRRN